MLKLLRGPVTQKKKIILIPMTQEILIIFKYLQNYYTYIVNMKKNLNKLLILVSLVKSNKCGERPQSGSFRDTPFLTHCLRTRNLNKRNCIRTLYLIA